MPVGGDRTGFVMSTAPLLSRMRYSLIDFEETLIADVIELLELHKTFFLKLREEGARTLIQASSFSHWNYTLAIPPEILGKMAFSGITFVNELPTLFL